MSLATEPNTADEVFSCSHFCCLLTKRACLRRQTEQRTGAARAHGKKRNTWSKPMHPYCASGTCTTGREVAAELAGIPLEPARDPRTAPRLDIVAAVEARTTEHPPTTEDTDMPKGQLNQKRTCCDTMGGRHKATCSAAKGQGRPTAPKKAASRAKPPSHVPGPAHGQLVVMQDEDLVELRDAVDAEMQRREADLERRLGAMRTARMAARARPEPSPAPAIRSAG